MPATRAPVLMRWRVVAAESLDAVAEAAVDDAVEVELALALAAAVEAEDDEVEVEAAV